MASTFRFENIFVCFFVLCLALIFMIPSFYKMYSYWVFRSEAIACNGVVTREGLGAYMGARPFVSYQDIFGVDHEIKSKINFHWFFAPRNGDSLKVLYRENQPEMGMVDSFLHYLGIPLIFFLLGIFLLYSVCSGRLRP